MDHEESDKCLLTLEFEASLILKLILAAEETNQTKEEFIQSICREIK